MFSVILACSLQRRGKRARKGAWNSGFSLLEFAHGFLLHFKVWKASVEKWNLDSFENFLQLKYVCGCVCCTNLGCILWYSFHLEAIFTFWTPQIFEGESKFNTLLLISQQKLLPAFVHNFFNQMLSVEWGEVHPGVMPLPPWSSYILNLAPRYSLFGPAKQCHYAVLQCM